VGSDLAGAVGIPDETKYEKCHTHISVHVNSASGDTNTIKFTHEFSDRTVDQALVTTGIKKDNLFVPILFRIAGDLSRERYEVPKGSRDNLVSLGEYDPNRDQLRFMALCSRVESSFPKHEEHPSNLTEYKFGEFTLTLLWSYLNRPSHPQAVNMWLHTKPETGSLPGMEWWEIYNLYNDLNWLHIEKHLEIYPDVG
jgi:hypothetical protein